MLLKSLLQQYCDSPKFETIKSTNICQDSSLTSASEQSCILHCIPLCVQGANIVLLCQLFILKHDFHTSVSLSASPGSDLLHRRALEGGRRRIWKEVGKFLQQVIVVLEEHGHLCEHQTLSPENCQPQK